jgi:N-methylhydantoinase B
MKANNRPVDPIELELFRNALTSIADEMALTITRTAYSSVLKDNMDFSTALTDRAGRVVAQGLTIAGHLGSVPAAMVAILARYGDQIGPGDAFILNDPYEGGMHLPDIFIVRPIFIAERCVAFAATVCHHVDVGGRVAGSNAADSTEIFQEGLRIPPLRLIQDGRRNATLDMIIERNVRLPGRVLGDIGAQLAACHTAEAELIVTLTRFGTERVDHLMAAVIEHTERLTRAAIRQAPDGEFSFRDVIDDDGIDRGKPIPLVVTVRKAGERLSVDWTGSAPQVKGAINSTLSYTKAVAYCAVRSILDGDLPCNQGFFDCIDVIAPPGTITNMVSPGACAARGLTGFRMLDCIFGALAGMVPGKVYAASDGGVTGISFGGWRVDRSPFIYVEFVSASWGGRPFADGIDGVSSLLSNLSLPSAEMIEAEQPLEVLSCEFLTDRGGAGLHRGGTAIARTFRFLEAEATLQVRADRRETRPYGLSGGGPGAPSANLLVRDGKTELLPAKLTIQVRQGDIFRHETAGAGGWGDPLQRDPDAVRRDVANGFVSRDAACIKYGVVVVDEGRGFDAQATAVLRARLAGANRIAGAAQ